MRIIRFPPSCACLALLAMAACGAPEADPDSRADAIPAQDQPPVDPEAPPPLAPAEPAALSAEETWRQRIAGRWSQQPGCGGMTWNFQADSFTTPGETHCPEVRVAEGPDGAVRVTGAGCTAEGALQGDTVIDIVLHDGAIDVTGVGNAIDTPGWLRCE